jgi:hypothetical protein
MNYFFFFVVAFAIISRLFHVQMQINIVATDDAGTGKSSPFTRVQITFIDMNGEPFFDERDDIFNTDFTGNEANLLLPSQVTYF